MVCRSVPAVTRDEGCSRGAMRRLPRGGGCRYILLPAMATSLSLLLEIGTEELPSSFVDAALAVLPKIAADELAKARLTHGEVRALGTPRRLAVIVKDVAARQLDLDEEIVGP